MKRQAFKQFHEQIQLNLQLLENPLDKEFEYKRNGTQALFAAPDVHDGIISAWVTDSTRSESFVAFLNDLVMKLLGTWTYTV